MTTCHSDSFFEAYLEIRRAQQVSAATIRAEVVNFGQFMTFLESRGFQGGPIAVIREEALLYSEHINGREDLKANSKLHRLQMPRYFYREAVRQEWILQSPWARIPLPRQERIVPQTLNVKQMKALLALPDLGSVQGIRDRTLMELMYSSGLRKGEVVAIRPGDFGEEYRTLRLKGKGGKEAVLPVGKMAAHFSRFYCEVLLPSLGGRGGCMFCALRTGRPLDGRMIERIVKGYGRQLGLKVDLIPHAFRYSIATHLSEEGVDLRVIQCFLRHDDIDTTARYIRHDFRRLQEVHRQTHPREVG